MSRIVRFHRTGGPEVLKIENVEITSPAKGEVQLKVKALGLNRAEAMFRSGQYLEQPQFPSRIGYEAAGIVEAVGPEVTGIKVGDAVSVFPIPSMSQYGVYGETATVPASHVVKHPETLSFVEAAATWMQYMTAYGALVDIANIINGDYVIITAASSSVGLAAIQLSNSLGAIPIAVTRTSQKKQALISAGAKHAIASQEEDLVQRIKAITNGKGARVAFDPIGGPIVAQLAEALTYHGILIEYGALSPEPTPFPLFPVLSKGLTMRGYTLFELMSNKERRERAKQFILNTLGAGSFKPIIDKTFKLDEIVEAHRHLESNQQFGKIVVVT